MGGTDILPTFSFLSETSLWEELGLFPIFLSNLLHVFFSISLACTVSLLIGRNFKN